MPGEGNAPVNGKVQGITERLRPSNLRDLRSFLGAVTQLIKFVPDLSNICAPFRSILNQAAEWKLTRGQVEAFLKVNQELKRITELTHFERDKELRIICDSSKQGLRAVLQQPQDNQDWKPVSFGSRLLTNFECMYSINELEKIAEVWAIDYFKNHVYGVKCQVISDPKALALVLKPNRVIKHSLVVYQSGWVGYCLSNLKSSMHQEEYYVLPRHPSEIKEIAINSEKLWNDWFTVSTIMKIDAISENETTPLATIKARNLTSALDSVLRVENQEDAQQAGKAKERKGNQPIKS